MKGSQVRKPVATSTLPWSYAKVESRDSEISPTGKLNAPILMFLDLDPSSILRYSEGT